MANGLKKHGITAETLKNLMFSAGTYYKNLKYLEGAWSGTVLGATSGGGGVNIEPEYMDAELDGANVALKGGKFKVGEVGKMKVNMTEFTENAISTALHLEKETTNTVEGYTVYKTKAQLEDEDYLENVAFVGNLVDGRQAIVIMENALCTSALELEAKKKEQATYELEFACHADLEELSNIDTLPIYVYFPVTASV